MHSIHSVRITMCNVLNLRFITCLLSLLVGMQVFALEYEFPGGALYHINQTYIPYGSDSTLELTTVPRTSTLRIMPAENRSGMGFYRLTGASGIASKPDTPGTLEIFLIHAGDYSCSGQGFAGIYLGDDNEATRRVENDDEKCCEARSPCDINDRTLLQAVAGTTSSFLQTDELTARVRTEAPVRRLTFHHVPREAVDLKNPVIQFDQAHCKLGEPSGTSMCHALSAVILRFIPYDPEYSEELTMHVIDPEKVKANEQLLRTTDLLLSSDRVWLAVLNQLFKYKPRTLEDGSQTNYPVYERLPMAGVPHDELMATLTGMADREKESWIHGTCSGTMYCGDMDFYKRQNKAFGLFSAYNGLQLDMHPSGGKMSAEIVAMTLHLHGGDNLQVVGQDGVIEDEAVGYVSLGGTDSNMAAMRAMNKMSRWNGYKSPKFLAPDTIHASIDKAADYYNLQLVKVPTDPETKKVSVAEIKRLIDADSDIAGIAVSAPGYSHGTTDPVRELSELLMDFREKGRVILLHVDACMGGFIYPFGRFFTERLNRVACEELKASMKGAFDQSLCHDMTFPEPLFSYPAVTSVSADLHKFGYSIKGNSVIMFRNQDLMDAQVFTLPDWDGGAMANYGSFGSRSEGLIAAGYYTMLSLGMAGYLERAWKILLTAHRFQNIVKNHPELKIIGDPGMCFAFAARDPESLNIFHIADLMKQRNPAWRFNHLQPPALHFCLTGPQTWLGQDVDTQPEYSEQGLSDEALMLDIRNTFENRSTTEDNVRDMAELLDRRLTRETSQATRRFSEDLAWAMSMVGNLRGQPAMSGSMYGLGATGIAIDNRDLRDAILRTGVMLFHKPSSRSLVSLLGSGKYRVRKVLQRQLQLPAY